MARVEDNGRLLQVSLLLVPPRLPYSRSPLFDKAGRPSPRNDRLDRRMIVIIRERERIPWAPSVFPLETRAPPTLSSGSIRAPAEPASLPLGAK